MATLSGQKNCNHLPLRNLRRKCVGRSAQTDLLLPWTDCTRGPIAENIVQGSGHACHQKTRMSPCRVRRQSATEDVPKIKAADPGPLPEILRERDEKTAGESEGEKRKESGDKSLALQRISHGENKNRPMRTKTPRETACPVRMAMEKHLALLFGGVTTNGPRATIIGAWHVP